MYLWDPITEVELHANGKDKRLELWGLQVQRDPTSSLAIVKASEYP